MIYYIAEVGLSHDGSLGIAHSYIDALAGSGINAIKFQMHLADFESSVHEEFRINFSYEDNTRFDYWKRTSFTFEQWKGLKDHCEKLKLDFIVSPFSIESCKWLNNLNVSKVKIGSGESTNGLMLDFISNFSEDIIFSTGLSDDSEIKSAYDLLNVKGKNISILHCITSYPSKPNDWNLKRIKELSERFPDAEIGYSDHSGEIFSSLAAITMGAKIIEFHVAFDKRIFGPDSTSSLTIDEAKNLIKGGNKIYDSLNSPGKKNIINNNYKRIFGKTLSYNRDMYEGDKISFSDLETRKPGGMGVKANDYKEVVNKTLLTDVLGGQFIKKRDFK